MEDKLPEERPVQGPEQGPPQTPPEPAASSPADAFAAAPPWGQTSGEGEAEGVFPSSAELLGEEEAPGPRPFLARLLNRLGIHTGRRAIWLLDWIQVLGVAAFLAWLTMSFVVVRMRVPTGSMEPTIQTHSSFFVDKISFLWHQPQPGDIVVFWHDETSGERVRYVKRLIAVGGQTVQIKDCGRLSSEECGVYVNGQKLTGEAFDRPYYAQGKMGSDVWTVPEGHYFVLGDNSRNSLDGRFWGYVDVKDFIGEPFLRVWPLNQFGFMNGYFGTAR
ncbi:MAG TPA: signal peptidase I [Candidatus Bipolaricaulota bacterium]